MKHNKILSNAAIVVAMSLLLPGMAFAEGMTESLISVSNFFKLLAIVLPVIGFVWGIVDMWGAFSEWKKGSKSGWQTNGPQKGQCFEMLLIGLGRAFVGGLLYWGADNLGLYNYQQKFEDEIDKMGPAAAVHLHDFAAADYKSLVART